MLALPVERLVGNTSNSSTNTSSSSKSIDVSRNHRGQGLSHHSTHHNHHHQSHNHHHRPPNSASPDSSTSAMSDCSSSTSSVAGSPSSSPCKNNNNNTSPSSPPHISNKSQSADLCNNDINTNRNNTNSCNNIKNIHSISPSPASPGAVDRTSPDRTLVTNSRKRRRSSSSCGSRSRSNSPSRGSGRNGHDLSRKGMMMIKQEDPSPRNSPPSCHSCCCQKSPAVLAEDLEVREAGSTDPSHLISNQRTSKSNNDCHPKIESGEDGAGSECANNINSNNKINGNNRTSAQHYYHHQNHHEESHSGGDHHHHHHFHNIRQQQQEETREHHQPSSRSKVNNRNHYNGDDNNESGGHPSLTVDNGLSSPGSISSTSSSNGRPPSRPPSTASTASSSCFSSVLSLSTSTPTNRSLLHNNHYNHLHHHLHNNASHQLKFSIDDILRPDFGKVRINNNNGLKSPNAASNNNQQNGAKQTKKPQHEQQNTHSSEPQQPTRPSSRESSFKYHSDDSNCSSTSRATEVVDDTKINPPVPEGPLLWPAWVYCTRYSDRPSSGPRSRRIRTKEKPETEEKRPRTAFTAEQLSRLKQEFDENRYLTEKRRQDLAQDLKLHENQIKIWFQNKRAKLKKSNGQRNGLAVQLMAQGLYNHSTVPVDEDDEMLM